MNFNEMTIEELETRRAAIAEEIEHEDADLDALEAEARGIKEELETRKANEAKKDEVRKAVAEGAGEVLRKFDDDEEERKIMNNKEVRSSKEYKAAYGAYIKAGYDLEKVSAEERALLTVNASEGGTIAVPVSVDEAIRTAWENDEIMQRIVKTYFKGNLKVGYEKSASGAVIHAEGGEAVAPENLVIDYTELIPQMLKKVVEVSDEVLANNDSMVDYLYDEIEYQIVKLAAKNVVQKIVASGKTASQNYLGDGTDVIRAEGMLGGEATNPVVITTRAQAAEMRAEVMYSTQNFHDPFDGLQVLYTDQAALGENVKFLVVDLSGVQGNFPEGYEVRFKFDDLTKSDEDIVRIVGRLYAGIDVVAAGKAVKSVTA